MDSNIYVHMLLKIWLQNLKITKTTEIKQYQIAIAIQEGKCTDDRDQKSINCLSRGGVTAVYNGCLPIFLMTEELFRKDTIRNPNKMDVAGMVDQLTTKPEIISIFNSIVEESGINNFFVIIEN